MQDYGQNQRIHSIQIELFGIILSQHCCPPTHILHRAGIVNSVWRNILQCYQRANIHYHIWQKYKNWDSSCSVGHSEGKVGLDQIKGKKKKRKK